MRQLPGHVPFSPSAALLVMAELPGGLRLPLACLLLRNIRQLTVLFAGDVRFASAAVEQTAHVYVAHDVDRRTAAVEEPIDRKQHGDVTQVEADGLEDQRHRDGAGLGD